MSNTRPRYEKPDLRPPAHAGWVTAPQSSQAAPAPQSSRAVLRVHLADSKLPAAEQESFLSFCLKHASAAIAGAPVLVGSSATARLSELSKGCGALLDLFRPLSSTTRADADLRHAELVELVESAAQELRLDADSGPKSVLAAVGQVASDEGLMSATWDLVDALRQAAERAAADVEKGRGRRRPDVVGSNLVSLLADNFRARTGRLPPLGPTSWFAAFMRELGQCFGISCGPKPVANAIRALRAAGAANKVS